MFLARLPEARDEAETIAETLRRAVWRTAAVNQFMLENRGADFYVSAGYDESKATTSAILDLFNF